MRGSRPGEGAASVLVGRTASRRGPAWPRSARAPVRGGLREVSSCGGSGGRRRVLARTAASRWGLRSWGSGRARSCWSVASCLGAGPIKLAQKEEDAGNEFSSVHTRILKQLGGPLIPFLFWFPAQSYGSKLTEGARAVSKACALHACGGKTPGNIH